MPDITMCDDKTCPLAPKCYRNELSGTVANEYRQSFFAESPRRNAECDEFWVRQP